MASTVLTSGSSANIRCRYCYGAMPLALAVSIKLQGFALVVAPLTVSQDRKFFLPTTKGRMAPDRSGWNSLVHQIVRVDQRSCHIHKTHAALHRSRSQQRVGICFVKVAPSDNDELGTVDDSTLWQRLLGLVEFFL